MKAHIILLTLSGMTMDVSAVHPVNACEIFVTLSGIVIEVRFVHPENADDISVTPSGRFTPVSPVQLLNANCSILSMFPPSLREVNPVQYANALPAIDVTLSGITSSPVRLS